MNANLNAFDTPDVAAYYLARTFISPCEKLVFDRYILPGMAVLDVGVGGGSTTAYLYPNASRSVGIDYAEETIRVCKNTFTHLDLRAAEASDLSCFPAVSLDT